MSSLPPEKGKARGWHTGRGDSPPASGLDDAPRVALAGPERKPRGTANTRLNPVAGGRYTTRISTTAGHHFRGLAAGPLSSPRTGKVRDKRRERVLSNLELRAQIRLPRLQATT